MEKLNRLIEVKAKLVDYVNGQNKKAAEETDALHQELLEQSKLIEAEKRKLVEAIGEGKSLKAIESIIEKFESKIQELKEAIDSKNEEAGSEVKKMLQREVNEALEEHRALYMQMVSEMNRSHKETARITDDFNKAMLDEKERREKLQQDLRQKQAKLRTAIDGLVDERINQSFLSDGELNANIIILTDLKRIDNGKLYQL